jgi:hypothetical protein
VALRWPNVPNICWDDETWEVVTPAQLGVVTWAAIGASSEQHRVAAAALTNDGYASVTTTTIRGRSVLRLCTLIHVDAAYGDPAALATGRADGCTAQAGRLKKCDDALWRSLMAKVSCRGVEL